MRNVPSPFILIAFTFETNISPLSSRATSWFDKFETFPKTLIFASVIPLHGPPVIKSSVYKFAGVAEPISATFSHVGALPVPFVCRKYPLVPGVSLDKADGVPANNISPVPYDVILVPPLFTGCTSLSKTPIRKTLLDKFVLTVPILVELLAKSVSTVVILPTLLAKFVFTVPILVELLAKSVSIVVILPALLAK